NGLLAQLARRRQSLAAGATPQGAEGTRLVERLQRALEAVGVVAEPLARLGSNQDQTHLELTVRAGSATRLRAIASALPIIAAERLLGCPQMPTQRALCRSTQAEVLSQDYRVGVTLRLQPCSRCQVRAL